MNTKYQLFILFIILAFGLGACGTAAQATSALQPTMAPPVPTGTPAPFDPAAIAQEFYRAANAGDLEAAMALVAEDVKCRGGCYLSGKEAFRSFIQGSLNIGGGGGHSELSDFKVEGDQVTYRWEAYNKDGNFVASGVETLRIKDGQIIMMEILPQ